MSRPRLAFALVLSLAWLGCDPHPAAVLDAACTGCDAEPVPHDGAADAAPDAPPFTCAAGAVVHLDVHPVGGGTIPNGRLIVAFYQLIDNLHVPEFIGYDVAFSGTATTLDLPLADIQLPPVIDDYRYCPRSCLDLANPSCDCPVNQAKLGLAFVFVMRDADGSGKIDPAELTAANLYGVGVLQLGESDHAYGLPNALDGFALDGIQGCLAPYSILPPAPNSSFDRLGIPSVGPLPLDVCVPESAACDQMRFPNLT